MSENPSDIVKMSACNLEVDDLVWAKVLESPHWPAKISQPIEMYPNENIPQHFVYLFGTHKNAWVSDANIVLHSDEMLEHFHTSKKSTVLQDAFVEMKHEIEKRKKLNTLSQRKKMSLGQSSITKLPNFPTAPVGEYSFANPTIPSMKSVNKSLLTSTKQKSFPIKCKLNNMNYSKKLNKLVKKVPQKPKHSNSFTDSKLVPTTTKDCKILSSTSKDYQRPSTSKDYQRPSTSKDYQHPSTSEELPLTLEDFELPTSKDYQRPSTSKDYQRPSTSKDYQRPKDYQHPSTSKDYQRPSTSKDYQRPSTSKDYQRPSTSKDYQHPSTSEELPLTLEDFELPTSKDYLHPSTSEELPLTLEDFGLPTSKDYQRPSTSKDYQCPSTSKDYQRPSTSKDYQCPSTSKDYQCPSTSKDYQRPSTSEKLLLTLEDFELLTSKDHQRPSTSKDYHCPSTSEKLLLTLDDFELLTSKEYEEPSTELINWKLAKLFNNEFPSSDVNKSALDSITSLDDCDNIPSDGGQSIDNTAKSLSLTARINTMSKVLRATDKEIGFLGLGKIGSMFAKKLLDTGHFLTVYNRSHENCDEFVMDGAEKAQFPADVIKKCDITFCCVSDEKALKDVVFGEKGVLKGFDEWDKKGYKAYVEMTPIHPKKSQEIGEKISSKCGKYLEAPFMFSRKLNKQESLLILCAGDTDLFHDCMTCFFSISSEAFYMGLNVGTASTIKVVLSMIMGAVHAALWETMSLLCQSKLPLYTFIEFLCHGRLSCKSIVRTAFDLLENDITFTSGFKSLQRDLHVASLLAESYSQPLPLAAAVNQYFVYAKQVDYKSLVAKYKEAMNEQDISENM